MKIICIAGGSGSGKTTLAEGLAAKLGERAALLHLDDYQHPKERVPRTASGRGNYDHPSAINAQKFVDHLDLLKSGQSVTCTVQRKTSSMEEGVHDAGARIVRAAPIVLVEGYLALHFSEARVLYDFSIFLRAKPATRVARRRWVKDEQYVNEVLLPMHDCFVEPSEKYATVTMDVDEFPAADLIEGTYAMLQWLAIIK